MSQFISNINAFSNSFQLITLMFECKLFEEIKEINIENYNDIRKTLISAPCLEEPADA